MKYRKKPVVIEAFQLGLDPRPDWFEALVTEGEIKVHVTMPYAVTCEINTLEGVMRSEPGDFIIRGVKGEVYPCKSDIFRATYERVEDK